MYHNVHLPVISLQKAAVKTGGLCAVNFFKLSDVLSWPEIDPLTGILSSGITLKPGAVLYTAETIDQARGFEETEKESSAGFFFDINIKASLRGSNASNILSLQSMVHHQWGIIAEDRNGVTRLVGNRDSGATLLFNYASGTLSSSRKSEFSFSWQHPLPAPIYTATSFEIIIGGLQITAGCIQLIQRFKVGQPGAPMNQGDTLYVNDLIKDKKVLVIADGMALPVDDFSGAIDWSLSIDRHIEKALASNTINFVGSVMTDETIEIYAYT